jgi:hypothetical protein
VPELTAAEKSTVESIVAGVQRRNARRRRASRSGWALLATAAVALPVIASAMDDAITMTTAVTRIVIAMALSMFVASALGSILENYQTQAALQTVEEALLNARKAAAEAAAEVVANPMAAESLSQEGPRDVTDANDADQ